MKSLCIILISLAVLSCIDNSNKNQAIDQNIDKEITERIIKIKELAKQNDTVFVNPDEVDKKIRDLILISKDIENLGASVNLSNQYFKELSGSFGINIADFEKINKGMHVNDIASALKQNEMIFFNHILLKSGNGTVPMHAVH